MISQVNGTPYPSQEHHVDRPGWGSANIRCYPDVSMELGVSFIVFRQGLTMYLWLTWNSLSSPGWPRTHKDRSVCLSLPGSRIKGECHLARPFVFEILVGLTQSHWNHMEKGLSEGLGRSGGLWRTILTAHRGRHHPVGLVPAPEDSGKGKQSTSMHVPFLCS